MPGKLSFLVIILLFFNSVIAFSQSISVNDVPYNVVSTYAARYGRVTETKWEKRKPDLYYVTFRKGDRNLNAEFSEDGRWQSTGEIISVGQLPREIIAAVAKNLKGHKMKSGIKKDTYMRGLVYMVITEVGGKIYEYTFKPNGKMLYYKEVPPVNP